VIRLAVWQLPLRAKVAMGITFFNTWVLFEETVIDRHGLWRYMPFYKVGDPCVWDLFVAVVIASGIWWASRHVATESQS
jgi:hypothetical protein